MRELGTDAGKSLQQFFRLGVALESVQQCDVTGLDQLCNGCSKTFADALDRAQCLDTAAAELLRGRAIPLPQVTRRASVAGNAEWIGVLRVEQIRDAFESRRNCVVGRFGIHGRCRAARYRTQSSRLATCA